MSHGRYRRTRDRMWRKNPHCENCGVLTVLPKDVDGKINPNNGYRQIKDVPPNMATIQHKYSRLNKKRLEHTHERRWFLWCHKCNHADSVREQKEYFGKR